MIWPFNRKKSVDINKPITNPALKSAFYIFSSNQTENNLKKVVLELSNANFLVLVKHDGFRTTKNPDISNATVNEGRVIKFFKTFDENGNAFIPLFTDWKEIGLWVEVTKDIASWVMTTYEAFNFVLKNKVITGLVINPCSDKWTMTKEQVDSFLKEIK
ncbi:MAG: SseB family protein [Mucilaginibacter sp.]